MSKPNAGPYNPTNDPPTIRRAAHSSRTWTSSIFLHYISEVLAFGPLPPNYKVEHVERTVGTVKKSSVAAARYIELGTGKKSWDHPLSPAGLASKSVMGPEYRHDRKEILGLFHPPIDNYRAGQWIFKSHNTMEDALAHSLTMSGQKITAKDVTAALAIADQQSVQVSTDLYHPADRDTVIYKNEPEASLVGSYYKRSLVVLTYNTAANRSGWDRAWNMTNRPQLYFRWSTGSQQGRFRCAYVACIPKAACSMSKEVHWFTISPSPNYTIRFNSLFGL